jgi:DNA-directed RNA polymerase specialized sigma24 family protein
VSEFSLAGIDPLEVVERLTLEAYRLFGVFPDDESEPALRVFGDGPKDLAMATFVKFLDPEDRTVKWKESWGRPTQDTLFRFLRKVMRNDFIDRKRSKRYHLTSYPEGESADGQQTMSFDDYAAAIESPEGQAIRAQQREQLLDSFNDEPELRDVLAVQLDPAGYCAHTNQDLAGLLDTSVSDIENRKKRIARRLQQQARSVREANHVKA